MISVEKATEINKSFVEQFALIITKEFPRLSEASMKAIVAKVLTSWRKERTENPFNYDRLVLSKKEWPVFFEFYFLNHMTDAGLVQRRDSKDLPEQDRVALRCALHAAYSAGLGLVVEMDDARSHDKITLPILSDSFAKGACVKGLNSVKKARQRARSAVRIVTPSEEGPQTMQEATTAAIRAVSNAPIQRQPSDGRVSPPPRSPRSPHSEARSSPSEGPFSPDPQVTPQPAQDAPVPPAAPVPQVQAPVLPAPPVPEVQAPRAAVSYAAAAANGVNNAPARSVQLSEREFANIKKVYPDIVPNVPQLAYVAPGQSRSSKYYAVQCQMKYTSKDATYAHEPPIVRQAMVRTRNMTLYIGQRRAIIVFDCVGDEVIHTRAVDRMKVVFEGAQDAQFEGMRDTTAVSNRDQALVGQYAERRCILTLPSVRMERLDFQLVQHAHCRMIGNVETGIRQYFVTASDATKGLAQKYGGSLSSFDEVAAYAKPEQWVTLKFDPTVKPNAMLKAAVTVRDRLSCKNLFFSGFTVRAQFDKVDDALVNDIIKTDSAIGYVRPDVRDYTPKTTHARAGHEQRVEQPHVVAQPPMPQTEEEKARTLRLVCAQADSILPETLQNLHRMGHKVLAGGEPWMCVNVVLQTQGLCDEVRNKLILGGLYAFIDVPK